MLTWYSSQHKDRHVTLIHTPVVDGEQHVTLQAITEPQIATDPATSAITAISAHIVPTYKHKLTQQYLELLQQISVELTKSITDPVTDY